RALIALRACGEQSRFVRGAATGPARLQGKEILTTVRRAHSLAGPPVVVDAHRTVWRPGRFRLQIEVAAHVSCHRVHIGIVNLQQGPGESARLPVSAIVGPYGANAGEELVVIRLGIVAQRDAARDGTVEPRELAVDR